MASISLKGTSVQKRKVENHLDGQKEIDIKNKPEVKEGGGRHRAEKGSGEN